MVITSGTAGIQAATLKVSDNPSFPSDSSTTCQTGISFTSAAVPVACAATGRYLELSSTTQMELCRCGVLAGGWVDG